MNWKNLVWGVLASVLSAHAGAVEPWVPNDSEMANLPPFCKARMKSGSSSSDFKAWQNTLGNDFLHTHHYCAGINFISRYYRSRSKQDKVFNLNNALTNLTYMVEHSSPDYSLMPDVYLNRGLTYSLMKRQGEAMTDMNKAIELNPNQAKAYNVLADYYASTQQKDKALETITKGLQHNPDTQSLQRRYTELGGKLPYPAPISPVPVEAAPAKADETPAVTPASPAQPAADTPVAATPAVESVSPPPIGSPKNPYCRFCPD